MWHSDFDGCNCVADVLLQFLYRVRISPPSASGGGGGFSLGTLEKYRVRIKFAHDTGSEGHNISHAVAAIRITMLHRVCLNLIRRAQLCIDAGGNHFQHLLWQYILSAFGYCINFCIYAILRTRARFSWPTLYNHAAFSPKHWTELRDILKISKIIPLGITGFSFVVRLQHGGFNERFEWERN